MGRETLAQLGVQFLRRSDLLLGGSAPIVIQDLEGRIVDLNEAAVQIHDWKREELLGQPIKKLVPPEWHEWTDDLLARCRRREAVREAQSMRWTRSGERIPVLLTVSPLTDLDGSLLGIATTAQGAFGLKEHEAILGEIEDRLRVVLRMHDLETRRVLYASKGYEAICGRPRERLFEDPTDWMEAILPEDRPRVEAAFEQLLRGEPSLQEYRIVLPDGTQSWIEDRATLIADSTDRPTRVVVIVRDITGRKRNREGLRAAVLAAERAEEIEREILASDLHDSVGQLLPLARMKLEALLDERGVPRLEGTIRELSALLGEAQQQVRTLAFWLSPVPIKEVGFVAAVNQLAGMMSKQRGLVVSVRDDGLAKPLDDDRAAVLFRGVRELLINVSRHAQTDKADVRIGREGDAVFVTVEDDGVGFQPTPHQATSFGLMSLRNRVEGVGGRFEIDSGPARGTRARLLMPV